MTENRQPKGIPAGGQFAADVRSEPDVTIAEPAAPSSLIIQDRPEHGIAWDTPEDQARFRAAAAFMDEASIEGTVTPLYTKYRTDDGLDALILQVDGRNMTVHHVGTMKPEIGYGDDENDAWTFRMEAGDGAGKNEHEVLADLVTSARHDAACQEAWRGSAGTFEYGETAEINDFGVRYSAEGERIISLTASHGRQYVEMSRKGDGDIQVFVGNDTALSPAETAVKLDVLAKDFDPDHRPGTGYERFQSMMLAAADRAAQDAGYNPRGISRP
jgi:hypothetical protein